MQIPPPSIFLPFSWKMHTVMNRMKNQFYDFCDFFLGYGWLYLQFTKNLPTKKKVVHNCSNLQERCGLLWKWFISSSVFFFVRLLVFEIWSILMHMTSCMQKTKEIFANLIQTLTCEAMALAYIGGGQGEQLPSPPKNFFPLPPHSRCFLAQENFFFCK